MQICWYHFSSVVSEFYDLPLLVVSWVIVPPFGGTKAYNGLIIGRIYNNSMETTENEGEFIYFDFTLLTLSVISCPSVLFC